VHVAEDTADVQDAQARGYAGPLERLDALAALPSGSVLAHGVHLDAAQVRQASDRGCWIVQNPRSNANNRVGYPGALRASKLVALGTDGFPSQMREEAAALEELGARHGDDPLAVARRLPNGDRLAHVLFAGSLPEVRCELTPTLREEIAAEARVEAGRLWSAMQGLPS
jgi:cytosine/adenosine deaminase-related metal-dependent hydrolase